MRVEFRKFDGRPHRAYPAIRLGDDQYGTWLGVPGADFVSYAGGAGLHHPDVAATRADPDPADAAGASGAGFKYEDPYVLLVPRDAWWTAIFNAPPRRTEIYCDVTTPAVWADDRVRLIDLDLDVRRRRGAALPELVDEDEFAEHRKMFGYPDHVVAQARAAASFLMHAVTSGAEPFAGAFRGWLAQVQAG